MKILVFLIAIALVLSVVIWRMRKAQAEEVKVRQRAIRKRKEKAKEAISVEQDMIWPAIVTTVKGEGAEPTEHDKELAMTEIAFESDEPAVSKSAG